MKQKRRHALLESLANTAAGFILSNVAWPAIQIYILHQQWRFTQGLLVVGIFTALSIGRNYVLRRAFDHYHHRGAP